MLGTAFFPDTAVFFTWQIEAVVRMRTTFFLLYLLLYLVDEPKLGIIGPLTHYKHLPHPIFLVTNAHAQLKFITC